MASDRFGMNAQQFRHLRYVSERSDPAEVFAACHAVLSSEPRSGSEFSDQRYAGGVLLAVRPPCPLSLPDAVRPTLPYFDLDAREWPWYLVSMFGERSVTEAFDGLAALSLTDRESRSLDTMRFWTERFGEGHGWGLDARAD